METERFEDNIKRQLQAREITPSAGSWDKLSAKLEASQEKKKPLAFWMGIAASIIGGVLILSLVFNNSSPLDSPEIVDGPKEELKREDPFRETSEEIYNPTQEETVRVAAKEEVEEEQVAHKSNTSVPPVQNIPPKNREAVASIEDKAILKEPTIISSSQLPEDAVLDVTLTNALANVFNQTQNGETITDAEVNKLLAEAAAKITRERYKTDFAVGKVNSQDLLRDVEFEMDNSFRDKIFEMLKEGYSKAKTAVANRNY